MGSIAATVQRATAVAVTVLGVSVVTTTSSQADADPSTAPPVPNIAVLVAEVARANQHLADLEASVHSEEQAVNKALSDVRAAREASDGALRRLGTAQREVQTADIRITQAQKRFDEFAVSMYVNGPSDGALAASSPEEVIAATSTNQTLALAFGQAQTELLHARTEQVNLASQAQSAKDTADQSAREAQSRYDDALLALRSAQGTFARQRTEIDRAAGQLRTVRRQLDEARPTRNDPAVSPPPPSNPAPGTANWDMGPGDSSSATRWDTVAPVVPTADLADPAAIVNAVLQISASSAQMTANLGRQFLAKLGLVSDPAPAAATTGGRIPRVYGQQAAEYVIRRGMTQIGVPYSWGGGNAGGATRGIDQGAGTVGFDCSGLLVYAFAGVGIDLPKYSGSQYNLGRRVPVAQMRRGDLVFYGPNGSQHVALYLGQGQMLEAPFTGSQVRIAPLRTSGMTTHVVRLIEY